MPRKNLDARFVATAKSTKRIHYFDAKEAGLVLRVSPTAKTWWFVFRAKGSRALEWYAIGNTEDVSLAKARGDALDLRRAVRLDGRNPAAERRAEKEAIKNPPPAAEVPTVFAFADMARLYEVFAKGKKKTWRADVSKIKTYLLPAWGTIPVADISRTHVHELLDKLAADGMTVGVNRIQALISRVFTLALDRSLIEAHPAARMMKRFKEQASERVLRDDELRALCAGLDAHPGRAADAVRLRLLLGQRGEETVGMQWRELDLAAGVWELPGARTKNGRPHAVPLPKAALTLLERRRAELPKEEPRVFPGLTLTADDHRALSVIHQGAYEWKDLRRTVGTRLAELGFDDTTIGRVLNHARVTVTAKHYNQHAYLTEKRQALDAWDRELERVLVNEPKKAGKVRAFTRR